MGISSKNKKHIKLQVVNAYRERSNLNILKHKILHERNLLDLYRNKELDIITKQKFLLEKSTDETQSGWIGDFATLRSKKRKFEALNQREADLVNHAEIFKERVKQLKPNNVASLILFGNIVCNSKEVFTFDANRCSKCGNLYKIDISKHINKCLTCKLFVRALSIVEDTQTDSLSFKNQKFPLLLQNDPDQISKRANNATTEEPRSCIDRKGSYRKYLMQWASNIPEIPEDVKKLLYSNFTFIHTFNDERKCRAAPIVKIFYKNNLTIHVPYAARIAKELNNEPIPNLSTNLISNLLDRFEEISLATAFVSNFDKLPSFEILTHTFLRAEKRDDLANMFHTHKAASALRCADIKMRELIEACKKLKDRKSNWDFVPRGG